MAGFLMLPTISGGAFLMRSGAEEEEQGVIEVAPYWSAHVIGNRFSHPFKLHCA